MDVLEPLERAYREEHRPALLRALEASGGVWAAGAAAARDEAALKAAAAAAAAAMATTTTAAVVALPPPPPLTPDDEALAAASWEDFSAALVLGSPAAAGLPEPSRRAAYEEVCGRPRALWRAREAARARAVADFARFLRRARGLYDDTAWQEFESAFRDEPEVRAVGLEKAREMFVERTALLAARAKGEAPASEEEEGGKGGKKGKGGPRRGHSTRGSSSEEAPAADRVGGRRRRRGSSASGSGDEEDEESKRHRRRRRGSRGTAKRSASDEEPEEGEVV